jgi:hypothetical protein
MATQRGQHIATVMPGSSGPESYDWPKLTDDLSRWLRLCMTPIGMKLYITVKEMETIPRLCYPAAIHTMNQMLAQAARLGWRVGTTMVDLVGAQCGAVRGLQSDAYAGLARSYGEKSLIVKDSVG